MSRISGTLGACILNALLYNGTATDAAFLTTPQQQHDTKLYRSNSRRRNVSSNGHQPAAARTTSILGTASVTPGHHCGPSVGQQQQRSSSALCGTKESGPSSYFGEDVNESTVPWWQAELNSVINRKRLEDQWETSLTEKRRKSKPKFFSYAMCRAWVHAQNQWQTQQEWEDWIDRGEKNVCLVPSHPEEHYRRQGTWNSWTDFLGGGDRQTKSSSTSPDEGSL